jgi:uncharacterized membrane protein
VQYAADWFAMLVRWFHFMFGVAWIGASFYFVWLNNTVRPADPSDNKPDGVAGNLWAVHGGAFYEVTKYAGAPSRLPKVLHWFKWEAYLTWISGFILLILHFWLNASTTMVDPNVAAIGPWAAVGLGAATLGGGWLLYDGLCRSPLRNNRSVLAGLLFAIVVGAAFGLSQVLSARAAYIHVGAMLGTWMAANVFFVIIPGQKAIVDAMIAGTPPPLERGKAGALRSLHNNYFTLPVLFIMISGHFPQTWGNAHGWLVLAGLGVVGATYRHWTNLDEQGVHRPWLPVVALALFVVIAALARPTPPAAAKAGEARVKMAEVQKVVAARCLECHATEPLNAGFPTPPKGMVLDTPAQIMAAGPKIYQQVVVARFMPLGNLTKITDEERELIARWCAQEGFAQ